MGLRVRIAALLGGLVALNAAFVLALLWAYGVFLPTVVAGAVVLYSHGTAPAVDLLRLPVSWSTYGLLVAGFLAAQVYYGYRRVLAGTAGDGGDRDHRVGATVRRLSMQADLPEPGVRVVDDETPSCYTVGRFTDATIVVTTGLVEQLDADELEAVLAHELAHVANRDVTLMTITTLFLEVADRAYHHARLARRAVANPGELRGTWPLVLRWFLPLVVLTYVFVSPILALFPALADRATRTLAHAREFAADAAAARMTGEPLALATALLSLAEATPTPGADLRVSRTSALCILPSLLVSGVESESLPDGREPVDRDERRQRVAAWLEARTPAQPGGDDRTATHPPVRERIRRLQTIAADIEGAT